MYILSKLFLPLSILLLFVFSQCNHKETELVPLSEKWERVIPTQDIPLGLKSISAESCGKCHEEHYKEWQISTHALAWSDAQFQSEIKKESSPFFCINCHIPLQNQQDSIVEGKWNDDIYRPKKVVNPHFDKELQKEAITCAVCHVRDGAIIGMNNNSMAPHKMKKDPQFLSEQLCINCHNANTHLNDELVCTFETGDEWKKGKYANTKNCITCHMEVLNRPIVKGSIKKKSHFHSFPGSGIPKEKGAKVEGLNGFSVQLSNNDHTYRIDELFKGEIVLKNEFAGHRLPTGDPERFFLLKSILLNSNNDTLAYKMERIGEEWEWYPVAKKLSDNNFEVGESRIYDLNYKFKKNGKYKWHIVLSKHRMDQKTADYNKLGEEYPIFIEVYHNELSLEVDGSR